MKVLSLIDSLIAAGAERMAVNIANGLSLKGIDSHLCSTHSGGPLEEFVSDKVKLIVLDKRYALDIIAFFKLVKYVKNNHIEIIHAHSSSVFWAVMVKWFVGSIKVVWHDHYGFSEHLDKRPAFPLNFMARFLSHAFVVNEKLLNYSIHTLKIPIEKVSFLANFADLEAATGTQADIPDMEFFPKLVCLANLRRQKDHDNLLNAFALIIGVYPEARLYLVGGHFNDDYYHHLTKRIDNEEALLGKVFILGSRNDVSAILATCNLGILSSLSEGLPVSLLEYGMAQLPVVCTNVGDCGLVLDGGRCGALVPPKDANALAEAVITLLKNQEEAQKKSKLLKERVETNFSRSSAIEKILHVYDSAVNG